MGGFPAVRQVTAGRHHCLAVLPGGEEHQVIGSPIGGTLIDRFGHLVRELSKFATVGGIAFLIDFALFNYMTAQDVELVL